MSGSDAAAVLARANALLRVGRPQEAEYAVRSLLATEPDQVDAMVVLADALDELGRPWEALDAAHRAATLAPQDVSARMALVNTLRTVGNTKAAAHEAGVLMAMAPHSASALYCAAHAYIRNPGSRPQARQAIDRAVALAPGSAPIHNMRGIILWDSGQQREGLEEVQRALELDPQDPHALANLARYSAQRRRFGRSIRTTGAALRADPTSGIPQETLDLVVHEIRRRVLQILLVTLVATAAIAALAPTSWARPLVALLGIGAVVGFVAWIVRQAPAGAQRWLPGIWRRSQVSMPGSLVFLVLLAVVVGFLGFAPGRFAGGAALILGALLLKGLPIWLVAWVARRFRRGR